MLQVQVLHLVDAARRASVPEQTAPGASENNSRLQRRARRLRGPESNHARVRGGVVSSPIHRARLLFHHPPTATPACAIKIVVKTDEIRVTRTKISQLVRIRGL